MTPASPLIRAIEAVKGALDATAADLVAFAAGYDPLLAAPIITPFLVVGVDWGWGTWPRVRTDMLGRIGGVPIIITETLDPLDPALFVHDYRPRPLRLPKGWLSAVHVPPKVPAGGARRTRARVRRVSKGRK